MKARTGWAERERNVRPSQLAYSLIEQILFFYFADTTFLSCKIDKHNTDKLYTHHRRHLKLCKMRQLSVSRVFQLVCEGNFSFLGELFVYSSSAVTWSEAQVAFGS